MISSGYITYVREVKNKDKILQIQIKILKKIFLIFKRVDKNQIDKLERFIHIHF